MSLSCSRAAVHAGRPTDYVTSGRRPQLLRSIQHLRSCPFHSWTPPRCSLPIAHVRSIPPHREGGPHRMATSIGHKHRTTSALRWQFPVLREASNWHRPTDTFLRRLKFRRVRGFRQMPALTDAVLSARHDPPSKPGRQICLIPWCPKEPSLLGTTSERYIPGGVSPRGPGGSRTRWRQARWNHGHR